MRALILTAMALIALVLTFSGCSSAYWTRPGASLPELADESAACYRASIIVESPAALAVAGPPPGPLLPRTEPPPKLWDREPRQAAFEHFDEQLRYERCMKARGWRPARTTTAS